LVTGSWAQDRTTIEAVNSDISDNLDLEAVASLFAEAENLEEFEKKLNDPDSRYSNLDLNEDGYVDYLRVLEKARGNAHSITIQAVIGKDLYQDVATIDVEKDDKGKTRVQVVGDVYMYGPNYIIEPVYVRPPVIFTWFWGPRWVVWYSPWYYGYYPSYWTRWNPYPYHAYYSHVHSHMYVHHTYHYVPYRSSAVCKTLSQEVYRGDLAKEKPAMAFTARQTDVRNKYELDNKRGTQTLEKPIPARDVKSTGKEIDTDWKSRSEQEGRPTNVRDNKAVISKDERPTSPDREKPSTEEAKPRPDQSGTKEGSRDEAKPQTTKPREEASPRKAPKSDMTRPEKTDRPRKDPKPDSTKPSVPKPPSARKPATPARKESPTKPTNSPTRKSRSSGGGR
jgi:hypothetical protein